MYPVEKFLINVLYANLYDFPIQTKRGESVNKVIIIITIIIIIIIYYYYYLFFIVTIIINIALTLTKTLNELVKNCKKNMRQVVVLQKCYNKTYLLINFISLS